MISEVVIDDKKYVILPYEDYKMLKISAVVPHIDRTNLMSIDEAEAYSLELINKWSKEKSQLGKR